ncbi:senescence-associated carboxylesterase 101 [Neltuma alba]|uniref:senescence-associated carboxylesterase 101 n=1 Tax=Neltuma alba TaxID=207710 RepID=UPI0010A34A53|nr:senescence-associated carboxylesterase 101-like [Prosopis alba]XP_028771088.1 senescence-associated carboxylesterase 101-like [Prosopis alba]
MSQFSTNDYNTTFSSGVESASFIASSNLLRRPVETILELYAEISSKQEGLCFKVGQELDFTVIAFVATQINLQAPEQSGLVSSSALKDKDFPLFEFLCNDKFPCFSLHKAAISLFYDHREQLHQLKSLIDSSKPLMVTGHALGGSIASLFTLWLLDNLTIGSGRKHSPLCVTFGSPLLGDSDFQKAISRSPLWNSCFLHVASLRDPLPRTLIPINVRKPFGTFLLCSEVGSACFNDPDSILELLAETGSTVRDPYVQEFDIHQYLDIVQNLHRKAICKAFSPQPQNMALCDSLEATIIIQLAALDLSQIQQDMVEKLKLREITLQPKKKDLDLSKRLNDVKMYMANLEWYKKDSKAQETGMYDMYKKHRNERDQDIVWWKKELTLYWREMVEEAEMKPQKEGAAFRTRWLFAGTNYRRMIEPLDIADYYESGGKDYETQGRSRHYRQLEEWLKEDTTPSSAGLLCITNKQNVESILTLDSCFWARVEEALIACSDMKGGEDSSSRQKLIEFEEYVYGLLKNYAVSPEIFLKYSTYIRWWNEYQMLREASSDSKLASFMRNPDNYKLYSMGVFDFQ